jgi:integrase
LILPAFFVPVRRMTKVKQGRKRKDFKDPATGLPVVGLSRMTDGRWRIIGTQTRFTESNVAKAIEHYRKLTDGETDAQVYARTAGRNQKPMTVDQWWEYAAKEIMARPQWVAKKTGVEWIAYGPDIQPPTPLPSFKELQKLWWDNAKVKNEERRKVRDAWNDFVETTGIAGLKDITPPMAVKYRDAVHESGIGGKTQLHQFNRVRRLLRFTKDRAVAVAEMSRCLDVLSLLKPSESTISLDPRPIEPADFTALLDKAEGDNRAMVLLMLNAAMYLQEVIRVEWDELRDGCLITHRAKNGQVVRVAVLWPETVAALAAVKRRGDFVFIAAHGEALGISGAGKRFRALRKAAGVSATAAQLRDGALTAAASANVNKQLCDVLAGHRSGISDHYVKRNPKMVAPACEAIRQVYLKESAPAKA